MMLGGEMTFKWLAVLRTEIVCSQGKLCSSKAIIRGVCRPNLWPLFFIHFRFRLDKFLL